MVPKELRAYVTAQRATGRSDAAIRETLTAQQQWSSADIAAALAADLVADTAPISPEDELSFRVGSLYRAAWTIYRTQFWSFAIVYGCALLVTYVFGGMVFGFLIGTLIAGLKLMIVIPLFIVAYVALFCFQIIVNATQVKIITYGCTKRASVGTTLRWSWQHFRGFLWVSFLFGFVVVGFSAFLFVPGIIMSVWFAFAVFAYVEEGQRGFAALWQSKWYVHGHFWGILGRASLAFLPLLVVAFIPVVNLIGFVLYVPYLVSFNYVMYRSLKEKSAMAGTSPIPEQRSRYVLLAAIGLAIWFVIQVMLLGTGQASQSAAVTRQQVALMQQQVRLDLYAAKHGGKYPALGMSAAPDPTQFRYQPTASDTSYTLCPAASMDPHQCVTNSRSGSPGTVGTSTSLASSSIPLIAADRAFLKRLFASSTAASGVASSAQRSQ